MEITKIESLDTYLNEIGNISDIIAIWEQGSYLEGISDEFSDRDFAIIWGTSIPNAEIRLKVADKLGFVIHDIRDVVSIGQSFDLFSDGKTLFNIRHGTKDKETKWYEKLNSDGFSSDIEEILMSISAVDASEIYFQKSNWVYNLKNNFKLEKYKEKLLTYYKNKCGVDLALLEKSAKREDFLEFIKYLHKVIRSIQIIYLLENNLPIVSSKHFEKRFAKIENGEISKLIRNITGSLNFDQILMDILHTASKFGVEKSDKLKA